MQNAAAALDFQYTSRYNKVYFDPEGGIFLNRMLGYLKGYERESVLAPLFKMLEATFDLFVPLVMADIVNVGIAAHDLHYILVRCGLLLLLAFIGGLFIEKSNGQPVVSAVGLVLGDAACYVLGTAWFVFQMQCDLGYALTVCVYPFIVLDLAKIVVSCIVGALLRKRLVQAGVLHLKEA